MSWPIEVSICMCLEKANQFLGTAWGRWLMAYSEIMFERPPSLLWLFALWTWASWGRVMDLEGQRYRLSPGGHKKMSSILGWPITPSYMSPNANWGGTTGAWVQLCTWSTNKLWRSNSLWAWRIGVNPGVSVNIWELLLTSAQKENVETLWCCLSLEEACRMVILLSQLQDIQLPTSTPASYQHLSLLSWCSVIESGLVARV